MSACPPARCELLLLAAARRALLLLAAARRVLLLLAAARRVRLLAAPWPRLLAVRGHRWPLLAAACGCCKLLLQLRARDAAAPPSEEKRLAGESSTFSFSIFNILCFQFQHFIFTVLIF